MNEAQAIRLCLIHKDPQGFVFLVKQYRREAYMHAIMLVKNRDDALDLCQEAFAKAFNAIPRLQKLKAFYPWFYAILRNTCFNYLDKKKREKHFKKAIHIENETNTFFKPDTKIEKEEQKSLVLCCINEMPIELREILLMKYQNNYDYKTISELLFLPKGTVMSRLYNARKAFQKIYNKQSKGR